LGRCIYKESSRQIPPKESHILWAKSAGRCAFPDCTNRCIDTFEEAGTILLAEMAHILPHSGQGPRAERNRRTGINKYDNLVLLCPYHHELVDKAPDDYPESSLRLWKANLERRVNEAADTPQFVSKEELYRYVQGLLTENKAVHNSFGPSSQIAQINPASNVHRLWQARKIEQILPNNANILAAIRRNRCLIPQSELQAFAEFEVHATAFSASSATRLDSAPMFPTRFAEIVFQGAQNAR
jgi:hypothetical protein